MSEMQLDHDKVGGHLLPMTDTSRFLEGKLLVAMPGMGDMRFERAVIFMCAHSADGAMGLMINKRAEELSFADLLEQLDIRVTRPQSTPLVYFGGPVEHGRGFVLHTGDYNVEGATMGVDGGFGMTATLDILRDIAEGRGPRAALLALGYAGWGPGQLEDEIAQNAWLTCDADTELVFETPDAQKWEAALKKLGISALTLSADAGRA